MPMNEGFFETDQTSFSEFPTWATRPSGGSEFPALTNWTTPPILPVIIPPVAERLPEGSHAASAHGIRPNRTPGVASRRLTSSDFVSPPNTIPHNPNTGRDPSSRQPGGLKECRGLSLRYPRIMKQNSPHPGGSATAATDDWSHLPKPRARFFPHQPRRGPGFIPPSSLHGPGSA
jgi:hypothetical protein